MYFAFEKESFEIIQLLLSQENIDANIYINTRTIWLKSFIKFGVNIHYTPLHFACEKGNLKIVQLLLSKPGIEINCQIIQNK